MAPASPQPGGGLDPEAHLNSLDPIGWKLGLDRMRMLCTALGMPQHRFASIHVVGTNGKSSVARMTAALLEAHGVRSGCSLSPHMHRWSERVVIAGEEIHADRFARAVAETARAVEGVNRKLEEGEVVTQFEQATAASFVALAEAGVEVGVVEAGLGGRLDATNTIPSRATVLTSVGLDHTEWLGETELEIAGEKLAVLRDFSALIVGGLSDEVLELARERARGHGAELIEAPADPGEHLRLRAEGRFQRRNFAIAMCAAEVILGRLDPDRVEAVAETVVVPGRLQQVAEDPPTYVDAAHNAPGAAALAESLPDLAGGRPVFACLGMLADKDGEGMVAALAPSLEAAVMTALPADALSLWGRPGAASFPPGQLVRVARRDGIEAEAEADPFEALARVMGLARSRGGIALVAGSHYLLGALTRD